MRAEGGGGEGSERPRQKTRFEGILGKRESAGQSDWRAVGEKVACGGRGLEPKVACVGYGAPGGTGRGWGARGRALEGRGGRVGTAGCGAWIARAFVFRNC